MAKATKSITNRSLAQLYVAVGNFLSLTGEVDFKLHYAVSLCEKSLREKNDKFEEARVILCKQLALKDEKGDPKIKASIGPDGKPIVRAGVPTTEYDFGGDMTEFSKALEELRDIEVEVDHYQVPFESIAHDYKPGFIPNSNEFFLFFVKEPIE